jgi:DNA ligase (NAD+)
MENNSVTEITTNDTITELKSRLVYYNQMYRIGTPVIEDNVYDYYLDTLKSLIPEHEYVDFRESLFDSISTSNKINHPYIMGSLEKIKAEEPNSVEDWIKENSISNKYLLMAKIDGMSCCLCYKNGILHYAASRGDGIIGENITLKAANISNIPTTLSTDKEIIYVRGEIVMTTEQFNTLNSESENKYKNPRNATVGIIGQKQTDHDLIQNFISFFPYEIMGSNLTRIEQLEELKNYGFDVVFYTTSSKLNNDNVSEFYYTAKEKTPYEIDGVVICDTNYISENVKLPKHMVAYKQNDLVKETTILDIDWGMPSKDGRLTPVAVLEPIELGGAMVSRVTTYNAQYIVDNKLKYGSIVKILKSGDIIPAIVEIIGEKPKSVSVDIPENCPCCDTKLVWNGVDICCKNPDCPAQTLEQTYQFIRKLGVKNAAKKTLENLGITSIYKLIKWELPRSATKSIVEFYESYHKLMYSSTIDKLLSCCNFKGIADKTFEKIWSVIEPHVSVAYNSTETSAIANALYLSNVDGIGEATIHSFIKQLSENLKLVRLITANPKWMPVVDVTATKKQFNNMSVCFTGSLNTMSRSEASKLAENAGYKVASGISKKLTYLVTNDTSTGTSKNKKAQELGIKIINEEEFLKLVKPETDIVESLDFL